MTPDGEQRPPEPPEYKPEYKVYRSRKGLFSRLKGADLSSLRDRARLPSRKPRKEREPRRPGAPRAPFNVRRVLKWVGIAALAWILISLVAFGISAQLQSFKLSGEARDALHGNPFLLFKPQTILVLGTDARPPGSSDDEHLRGVLRTAVEGREAAQALLRRRIPRRHADADPGRRRHLPQTLDPARLLRRDPRQRADEDQRRLRLRRRRPADQDDRTVPRDPDRPRRDRRLHRLRRPDRRRRRGQGRRPGQALRRHLRRRRRRPGRGQPSACTRARTPSTAKRPSPTRGSATSANAPAPARASTRSAATTTSAASTPSRK